MTASPLSLEDTCIAWLGENVERISQRQDESDAGIREAFRHFHPDVRLHADISERLLTRLCQKEKLSDLNMTIFNAKSTRLRKVKLPNASLLTRRGLKVLKEHTLVELQATGLRVTVNDLILSLGDRTLSNLRSLDVSKCSFLELDNTRFCVVVALSKLQNLRRLNVSYTEFNTHGLDIVCDDLPHIEELDISCTAVDDIGPLKRCRHRLRCLKLYNLKISNHSVISVILELTELRVLDWSDDKEPHQFEILTPKLRVSRMLSDLKFLPHLVSLDISGKEGASMKGVEAFLASHPDARFLGMLYSDTAASERFLHPTHIDFNPYLTITGLCSESQLLEGLRRYRMRPHYVQKILFHLFRLTPSYVNTPRVDIIELVLDAMTPHPSEFGVQMAATACLYNLTKGELALKIHPSVLKSVVDLTLTAMEKYPNYYQMQKNTLLTLCSDRILQDVPFDKYRCARLVLNCLCNFDDPSMNRMSVAICSILAAKICTKETHLLGAHPVFMRKLLDIVRGKVATSALDITIKFTLSALWNLTDESPTTCRVFLDEGGMELFQNVLEVFEGHPTIETKVLGLINNIAEVKELRPSLMMPRFISRLRMLLVTTEHMDVSYFAAGIIAHLACDGPRVWAHITQPAREPLLCELADAVLQWVMPDGEMVTYRSFRPFLPLLASHDSYQVQLWAAWAIHHVCAKNAVKYCPMLLEEGGLEMIRTLASQPTTQHHVRDVCQSILTSLEEQGLGPDASIWRQLAGQVATPETVTAQQ